LDRLITGGETKKSDWGEKNGKRGRQKKSVSCGGAGPGQIQTPKTRPHFKISGGMGRVKREGNGKRRGKKTGEEWLGEIPAGHAKGHWGGKGKREKTTKGKKKKGEAAKRQVSGDDF